MATLPPPTPLFTPWWNVTLNAFNLAPVAVICGIGLIGHIVSLVAIRGSNIGSGFRCLLYLLSIVYLLNTVVDFLWRWLFFSGEPAALTCQLDAMNGTEPEPISVAWKEVRRLLGHWDVTVPHVACRVFTFLACYLYMLKPVTIAMLCVHCIECVRCKDWATAPPVEEEQDNKAELLGGEEGEDEEGDSKNRSSQGCKPYRPVVGGTFAAVFAVFLALPGLLSWDCGRWVRWGHELGWAHFCLLYAWAPLIAIGASIFFIVRIARKNPEEEQVPYEGEEPELGLSTGLALMYAVTAIPLAGVLLFLHIKGFCVDYTVIFHKNEILYDIVFLIYYANDAVAPLLLAIISGKWRAGLSNACSCGGGSRAKAEGDTEEEDLHAFKVAEEPAVDEKYLPDDAV